MADDKKPDSNSLTTAVPVTVVLAMLAGLFLTHSLPYQDERPSSRPLQARYAAAQDVDARLWQDPFVAVDENQTEKIFVEMIQNDKTLRLDAAKPADTSSSHPPTQIYAGDTVNSENVITLLAVTLPGGPYQEDAERRMRRRYAVLSALANQRATPDDEQHIGYFQPDSVSEMSLQKKVPFEWWSLPDDKHKVLLLWVDESSLFGQPAAKLKELLWLASPEDISKKINYAIIGPNTSTLLRELLKEVKDNRNSDAVTNCLDKPNPDASKSTLGKINGQKIIYYSAGATASDERLLKDAKETSKEKTNETVSEYLCSLGVTLHRTTATDDAMMKVLVKELAMRQVKAHYTPIDFIHSLAGKLNIYQDKQKELDGHVVILSEWDTFYGQSMPVAFKEAWGTDADGNDLNTHHKVVHAYGYMRGLDGKLPDKDDKPGSGVEKKSDNKDKSDTDPLIEFPEGQNQKDYLRRLANTINELDRHLKEDEDNPKGVAGIGILGSDVHDQLMILEALRQHFPHKLFFTTDLDAAYSHPDKWRQTHNLLVASAFDLTLRDELQDKIPPFRDSYQTAFFLAAQLALNSESIDVDQIGIPPPRLFEIGRSRPIPLSTCVDKVFTPQKNDSNIPKCSWTNWSACISAPLPDRAEIGSLSSSTSGDKILPICMDDDKSKYSWKKENCPSCKDTVQPKIFATSRLQWTLGGIIVIALVAILLSFVSWWIRERIKQFMLGIGLLLILAAFPTMIFTTSQLHWIWGVGMAAIVFSFVSPRIRERVKFNLPCYFGIGIGGLLFLAYWHTPLWNTYITRTDAEPFYWHEGVSVWPSQLLRLSACLFAIVFFFWGHIRIQKMQRAFQSLEESGAEQRTFALPTEAEHLERCDVLFIGSWKQEVNHQEMVYPDVLWKKYLGYYRQKKCGWCPGSLLRVLLHGVVFFAAAGSLILWSGFPNVPVRGDTALHWHYGILLTAVIVTLMLTMWVVENARLCQRLIAHLSANPSKWNAIAKEWAAHENKIAQECVEDWLDIQLVARLTATMQPLIWGPVVCIALMMLARSPVFDDWDIPWGLEIVFIAMLLYAIFAEVFLQRGAKSARTKAIDQLTEKIREQRNQELRDKAAIKRIETEIERINMLRDGAFRPWYELPLLHSFGGVGALGLVLQYLGKLLGGGAM